MIFGSLLFCSGFNLSACQEPSRDQAIGSSKPGVVYTFDVRPLNRLDLHNPAEAVKIWDTLHLLAALQGLVNRSTSRFYLLYCAGFGVETDQFWLDWLKEEDGWLNKTVIQPITTLEEVLTVFRASYTGLVVYDPKVPATSNLASTAAGCDSLLPVRYDPRADSLYAKLVTAFPIPVKLWLIQPDGSPKFTGKEKVPDLTMASSGSAKCDAYLWGIEKYVKTAKCDPGFLAFYLDAAWLRQPWRCQADMHTLSNHDYFIAHKAFFFDLSPWGDERPNDDPQQAVGSDRRIFLELLKCLSRASKGSLIKVGGFPPWPFKYTAQSSPAGKHEAVPTEWEFGRLISQYNGYMEADAAGLGAMANASFYQHYPLAQQYHQPNPIPGRKEWVAKGYLDSQGKVASRLYVGHYVGDYDAPSWLYKAVPAFYQDPARGKEPLGWAFNPNLSDRCPQAMVYARRHATSNDFFIAGDSGAGYLNVRALTIRPESGLPSGLDVWCEHCRTFYHLWDISITGFMLDGSGGAATDREFKAYYDFSPAGIGTHFEKWPIMHARIPTCPERDLPDSVDKAAEVIGQAAAACGPQPGFLWARSILKSPRWYASLAERMARLHPEAKVSFADPYTFFGLIRLQYEQGHE